MPAIEYGKITYIVGAGGVSDRRLVKQSSGAVVHSTATSGDDPIGVTEYHTDEGASVAVRLLADPGVFLMTASGAISADADVYADDDGKVQALPTEAGSYRKIGIAREAAGADGDQIEVLPYDYHHVETVTA